MPAGLQLPVRVDLWAPLTLTPQQLAERWTLNLSVVGRLKQDVSLEQAQADMSAVMKRISDVHTQGKADLTARLVPLREQMVSTVRPTLIILFVTVGFVLLIACANVANLSLARMAERRKEIAIRLALGAGRARVMRQLLTESLLLALLGGAVGLILTVWGINGIVALIPVDLPRMSEIAINGRILGFTLAVSLLTGILFGIAPAIQTRVSNLSGFLKEGARRTTDGLQSGRLRSLLVISEVALALMLLIGTGLLVRSFVTLVKVDPGLDPSGVIALDIILPFSPQSRYTEDGSRTAFFRQLIERLEALPGVERAGAVTTLPLSGAEESTAVYIEGREPSPDERHLAPNAHYATITPGYFEALGIPVKQGRDFTDQDKSDGLRVIIINEAFARRYWPDDDPIGKRIRVGFEREPRVIVGVAGNVNQPTLSAELHYATYIPQAQIHPYGMTVLIRAREGAGGVLAAARGEVAALDKDLPIGEVRTMEEVISASLAQARFSALLTGLFASVALILAAAGIYAVVSYYATQRRHEIGIRMALGAEAGDVMKLVIGHGLKLTFIGVALGFAAAFTLTRLMASLLFGVSATDPATFALTPLMLIAIALLACYIPGRRATRLDPMIALRYE